MLRAEYIVRRLAKSVFARHVGVTFVTQIACLACSLLSTILVARLIGPEGKGTLALALLVPNMLQLWLSLGLDNANSYFAGASKATPRALGANSALALLITTTLGVLLVTIAWKMGWLAYAVPGVPDLLLWTAMLALPLGLAGAYARGLLLGLGKIPALNRLAILQAAMTLVMTAVLLGLLHLGLWGAMQAFLIGLAVATAAAIALSRREGVALWPRWQRQLFGETLRFGLVGHVGNVFQFFNYRLDLFLVNYFVGPGGAGIYTVSVQLAELLWQFPQAVGFVVFPRAAASDAVRLRHMVPKLVGITLLITALGAIALAAIGQPAIRFLFSSAFVPAYLPLLLLLPGVILLGAVKVLANVISATGHPQWNSWIAGLSLLVTIAADLILIPRLGVPGAALASTLTYTVSFGLGWFFYRKVLHEPAGEPQPAPIPVEPAKTATVC